ncbi:MAG: hypothetical protein ACXWCB_06995 [Acidimicrobiales bacterium]
MEASAQCACAPTQVVQIQLGVVVENNFVFKRRVDLSAGLESYSLQLGIDVAQCLDTHFEPERDSQRALACSRTLQLHLLCVSTYPDKDFRKRNVLFGVEILRQLLVAEHLVADQNSLTGINSTEAATHQRSPAHGDVLAAVIFQKNQVVIPEGHQPIGFGQVLEYDIGFAAPPK